VAAVAHRPVKPARLLRRLPRLAAVVQSGQVCAEQVQQVARLADQVGVEQVAEGVVRSRRNLTFPLW
jgi:hypothetical protein